MSERPTLVLVHAHPDDEALFTAGTARHYADLGHRVVLVTCTDGRLGLDVKVRAGNDPRHDPRAVAITRAGELAASVSTLGIARHVSLGYHDSGLPDWSQGDDPTSFVNADVGAVARTLTSILDEEGAAVVITYDENGYYGHPDHIMAHQVTMAAVQSAQSVQRLFYPVTPRVQLAEFIERAEAKGVSMPLWVLDAGTGTEASDVAVTIDAQDLAAVKRASIEAHASQVDNADLVTMDEELFILLFGLEHYRLGWSRTDTPVSLDDLFGGVS
jgi:LmbE family N-acetylglucosaminyl deacetylase